MALSGLLGAGSYFAATQVHSARALILCEMLPSNSPLNSLRLRLPSTIIAALLLAAGLRITSAGLPWAALS